MNIDENIIIDWAMKYHQACLTDDDQKALDKWLDENEENVHCFNKYRKLYCQSRSLAFTDTINRQQAWSNISNTLQKKSHRLLPKWTYRVAAIFIIALGIGYFLKNEISTTKNQMSGFEQIAEVGKRRAILTFADGRKRVLEEDSEQVFDEKDGTLIIKDSTNSLMYSKEKPVNKQILYNEIKVPRGGEYSLRLADGTKVWLNAESKLRYPVQFNGKQRIVHLEGEAYFEVAHNKNAPFIISVHDTRVRVLGTKFNISAYKDQSYIATTLVEGSVQVDYLKDQVILVPGKQSMVLKGKDGISVNEVDPSIYTAWVHGVYEFEKKDLGSIMTQLGRWYNVNFFFTEPHLKKIKFTGAIQRNESINYAIERIESITNLKFKIKGVNIIIEK